jgi:hypothetical protein
VQLRPTSLCILTQLAVASSITACSRKEPPSDVKELTYYAEACHQYDAAQVAAVKAELPAMFLAHDTEGQVLPGMRDDASQAGVLNQWAGIPKAYRDQLYGQQAAYGFQIRQTKLDPKWAGMAYAYTGVALGIELTEDSFNATYALQHEVGHVMQALLAVKYPTIYDDLRELLDSEGGLTSMVRDYSKTNEREYFADAFASFYCSPESNQYFATNVPKTYALMSSILEAPVWKTPASGGHDGADGGADDDGGTPITGGDGEDDALSAQEQAARDYLDHILIAVNLHAVGCTVALGTDLQVDPSGPFFDPTFKTIADADDTTSEDLYTGYVNRNLPFADSAARVVIALKQWGKKGLTPGCTFK